MLDKLSGTYVRSLPPRISFLVLVCFQAPRPSPGPHRLRESLPLSIFLRNRLKYALNGSEVTSIVQQRLIKVDGKVRTDNTYPTGFMGALPDNVVPFDVLMSRQMCSPSRSLASTSACFTMSRVASLSTGSLSRRRHTSSSR